MNTTWFKAHRIFVIAFLITILHFVLTSVIGYYIANQIGTQMGQIVAEGLIEANKSLQTSEEEAKKIYQNMKEDSENIIESWRVPFFLISLPIKLLMNPLLKNIRESRLRMVLSKEISKKQFYSRVIMTDFAANLINSVVFGLVVYMILRMFNYYRLKHNNSINPTQKRRRGQ